MTDPDGANWSNSLRDIEGEIRDLIKKHHSIRTNPRKFVHGSTRIPLAVPTFGWEEIWESIDSLLSTNVTMGAKVKRFEAAFADYVGTRHAVMVNSGSSANLLALSVLSSPAAGRRLRPGDEVITPAVTWSTSVSPIIQVGAVPVLVDVELDSFNMDVRKLEAAITEKTVAIMPVHLLGNPCDMDGIMRVAEAHDLVVIEDACESLGAAHREKKVGTFGEFGTFSFFFSHHITTIEGGMLVTDNDEYAEIARSMRVFGWARDLANWEELAKRYVDVDPRFMFVNMGFNLRPTEIQGAFGIHQMARLDEFIDIRRKNARYWTEGLERHADYIQTHREREGTEHVWFAYPLVVRPDAPFTCGQLAAHLERNGVETRAIMSGNFAEQPVMDDFPEFGAEDLTNARLIARSALLFGNHAGVGPDQRSAILDYIEEFVEEARSGRLP